MTDLPDVNVWLALSLNEHIQYGKAREYWESMSEGSVAFCSQTVSAFVRLMTNPYVTNGAPLSLEQAWTICRQWIQDPAVVYMEEPSRWMDSTDALVSRGQLSIKLWPDTYLAGFAIAGDMRLVTFDRDFLRFPGLDLLLLEA